MFSFILIFLKFFLSDFLIQQAIIQANMAEQACQIGYHCVERSSNFRDSLEERRRPLYSPNRTCPLRQSELFEKGRERLFILLRRYRPENAGHKSRTSALSG